MTIKNISEAHVNEIDSKRSNISRKDRNSKRNRDKNSIGVKSNRKEFRYKNLSQEMEDFCKILG